MKAWHVALMSTSAPIPGPRQFMLPREIGLLAGQAVSLFFAPMAFLSTMGSYSVIGNGPGTFDATHWTWASPTVGNYKLVLRLYLNGALIGRATTTLRVRALASPANWNPNGDSLTAAAGATSYVSVAKGLLSCVTHGTQNNGVDDEEGHPGYTWGDFNGERPLVNPTPYPSGGAAYAAANGGPFSDITDYLGTNDTSGIGGDPSLWPGFAQDVANSAESFVATQKDGSPSARYWISTIYNPGTDVALWTDQAEMDTFLAKRLILVPTIFNQFRGREAERIRLVPLHCALDPIADFSGDKTHFTASGHARVAALTAGAINWGIADGL